MILQRFLSLFILLCGSWLTAETVTFPADTAIWEKAEMTGRPVLVLSRTIQTAPLESRRLILRGNIIYRQVTGYRVNLDGREYWMSPACAVVNGRIKIIDLRHSVHLALTGVFVAVGILLTGWFLWFRRRYPPEKFRFPAPVLLIAALVAFHFAWTSYLFAAYPGTFQSPTDDEQYFRIANSLLQWDFSKPFSYTLGYPLFCIPFIRCCGGSDFFALSQAISYFSVFVMVPFNMAMTLILLTKLGASAWKAFLAILLWMLAGKLFLMVEAPYFGVLFSPLGIWHAEYIFLAYQFCLIGFNSLSEWISIALLLTTAVLALSLRGGWRKYLLLGLLFGLACLVRLNNIFWAPFLAYLFWLGDRERLTDWRYLAKMAAAAVAAALAVFVWQLVVNRVQFGHYLTFPYVLHPNQAGAGFQWSQLISLTGYYSKIMAWPLCLALPALAVIRDRNMRNGLILWVVPMMLFFCGFAITGQHYRFLLPLFYGMTAAVAMTGFWERVSWRSGVLLGVFLAVAIIPVLPFEWKRAVADFTAAGSNLTVNLSRIRVIVFLPLLVLTGWIFRRDRQVTVFLLLFLALLLLGSAWLYLTMMVGLLVYAGVSFSREYYAAWAARSKR